MVQWHPRTTPSSLAFLDEVSLAGNVSFVDDDLDRDECLVGGFSAGSWEPWSFSIQGWTEGAKELGGIHIPYGATLSFPTI